MSGTSKWVTNIEQKKMMNNKYDLKNVFIVILAIALLLMFLFGQKSNKEDFQKEIDALHLKNTELTNQNDSLKKENTKLDVVIVNIEKEIAVNQKELAKTNIQLQKLNKKRNEILTYVNSLSSDGVAESFTEYLERAESPNGN